MRMKFPIFENHATSLKVILTLAKHVHFMASRSLLDAGLDQIENASSKSGKSSDEGQKERNMMKDKLMRVVTFRKKLKPCPTMISKLTSTSKTNYGPYTPVVKLNTWLDCFCNRSNGCRSNRFVVTVALVTVAMLTITVASVSMTTLQVEMSLHLFLSE